MGAIAVTAVDLACYRGERCIVAGISFALGPGDCLAFAGPNGIGKTTALRAVAGLGGRIEGVLSIPHGEAAYLGTANGIADTLSVRDNLKFWHGAFGAAADPSPKMPFGLDRLLDREARFLSTGQKRCLALACHMAAGRQIWLVDEPALGLDAEARRELGALTDAHCDGGGIAIFAAHGEIGTSRCRHMDLSRNGSPP